MEIFVKRCVMCGTLKEETQLKHGLCEKCFSEYSLENLFRRAPVIEQIMDNPKVFSKEVKQ